MTDIIIANDLPRTIVALRQDVLDEAMDLAEKAHFTAIPADASDGEFDGAFACANILYKRINALSKALDAARLDMGRPILALKAQLDEAARAALLPLEEQRRFLGAKLAAADAAQRALHAKRQREAEEAARAEEARMRAEAEAKRLAEHARAIEEAPPWEAPPVLEPLDGKALVRPVAPAYVPPPPKAAVRVVTRKVLHVFDAKLIPRDIAGTPLWLLDTKTVERLLRAGIGVPGAELRDEISTSATRSM